MTTTAMSKPAGAGNAKDALRILAIAQYPCVTPKHGGQVRLAGILAAMEELQHSVYTLGVYADFMFPPEDRGPDDLVIVSDDFRKAFDPDPLFGDVLMTEFIAARDLVLADLTARIRGVSPDIIWLEQPFLYPVVEAALDGLPRRPRLILSVANEEVRLKEMLADMPHGPGVKDIRLFDHLAGVEAAAQSGADVLVCINDEEAARLRADHDAVFYLPATSVVSFKSNPRKRPAKAGTGYIAYAASAYWPNVDGFFDMFPDGAGFLKLGTKLQVCGSVCDAIFNDRRYQSRLSINNSRVDHKGFLPAEDLAAFYQEAAAVIVPITLGAGSNLKTADALASGRPVIATSCALRGFRSLIGDALGAGVYEASSSLEFRQLCVAALAGKLKPPPPQLAALFRSDNMTAQISAMLAAAQSA